MSPEITGPTSDGTTHAAANAANTAGRRASGKTRATSTYRATMYIPVPRPWTTRPATKTSMVGASPETTRPARNMPTPPHSDGLGPNRSHHRPAATMPTTLAAIEPANATA